MRKIALASISALFLLTSIPSPSSAAVSGSKCTKAGTTKTVTNIKYTCVKQGNKLVWNKGVATKPVAKPSATPTPTPTETAKPEAKPKPTPTQQPASNVMPLCAEDPEVPAEWAAVQQWSKEYMKCAFPYRYLKGDSNFATPKTEISPSSALIDINKCKISDPVKRPWRSAAFPMESTLFNLARSAQILVLPVQFLDVQATTSPKADYEKYINFNIEYAKNSSDIPLFPKATYVANYLQLNQPIAFFSQNGQGLNDEHGEVNVLQEYAIDAAKKAGFNIGEFDQIVIVPPPNASRNDITFHMNFRSPPRNLAGRNISIYQYGPIALVPAIKGYWGVEPNLYQHEQVNHQQGLDDTVADWGEAGVENLPANPTLEQIGMGYWGNMSGAKSELITWHKWVIGYMADSQIRCVSKDTVSTHWLRPATINGQFIKTAVIPLSATKAVVVESERSFGYNFKFPKSSNGALVYLIDVTKIHGGVDGRFGYGAHVLLPNSRQVPLETNKVLMAEAPLRLGEVVEVGGIKITVIESGDFGDVIKVEPDSNIVTDNPRLFK